MAEVELGAFSRDDAFKHTDGFPVIADSLSEDPDHKSFVFREFANLSARRLLHLQSERIDLEQQQSALDREVALSDAHELHSSLRSWEKFNANAKSRDDEKKRKELADAVDVKLEKYRTSEIICIC